MNELEFMTRYFCFFALAFLVTFTRFVDLFLEYDIDINSTFPGLLKFTTWQGFVCLMLKVRSEFKDEG